MKITKTRIVASILAGLLLAVSSGASATQWCGPSYVHSVSVDSNGRVLYVTSSDKRTRLAGSFSEIGGKAMFELLSLAVNSDLQVQGAYPDGYNCDKDNIDVAALEIDVQNSKVDR